jgi:hypothetical protein
MTPVTRFTANVGQSLGPMIMQIMTSAGPLQVKRAPMLTEFCHVGDETSFEHLEWVRVGKIFEEEILCVED